MLGRLANAPEQAGSQLGKLGGLVVSGQESAWHKKAGEVIFGR
jgi:hypothetical protein